ncbi:MAG: hypothetical protein AAF500_04955 [Myxococcota bacterium]
MAQDERTHATTQLTSPTRTPARTATVVHDGSAFQLSADLRQLGFEVTEGPLLSFSARYAEPPRLAILATKPGAARAERLHAWTRELCAHGTTVVAVGASMGPLAEFFGSRLGPAREPTETGRLADVAAEHAGLFVGAPLAFRLALAPAVRIECQELSSEFAVTARCRDGELVGASHVFRPIHLVHGSVLESSELRPLVLGNLLRLVRDRGGRAF